MVVRNGIKIRLLTHYLSTYVVLSKSQIIPWICPMHGCIKLLHLTTCQWRKAGAKRKLFWALKIVHAAMLKHTNVAWKGWRDNNLVCNTQWGWILSQVSSIFIFFGPVTSYLHFLLSTYIYCVTFIAHIVLWKFLVKYF